MSNKLTKRALSCAVASSALFSAIGAFTPALAQIDEIIVTSQKREQSLQSIPISVTAFDSAALESKQIDTFSDLQFNTPNVTFTAGNFNGSNMQIRGIGSNAVAASGDGGVGIHINDAPMRSTLLNSTEYYDVERVEILRGPQGTLFGRNATGGVLNMITKKASTEGFEGAFNAQVGNYNHQKVGAMLNIPLGENLAVRVAGIRLTRDGYTQNLYTGNDIDGRNQDSIRLSAKWTPGDNTTIDFMYQYHDEESSRARIMKQMCHHDPSAILGCLPDKLAFESTNNWASLGGTLTSAEFYDMAFFPGAGALLGWGSIYSDPDGNSTSTNPDNLREVYADFDPTNAAQENVWTATFEHEFDQHTLTIVGSSKEDSDQSRSDYNWTVSTAPSPAQLAANLTSVGLVTAAEFYQQGMYPISSITPSDSGILGGNYTMGATSDGYDESSGTGSQWTAEARIRSDRDGEFNYLVGGFMMHTESEGSYYVVASQLDYAAYTLAFADGFGASAPYYRNETAVNELDSWAIFGEAYFDVNDDIRITAGLRLNNDEKVIRDGIKLFGEGGVAHVAYGDAPDPSIIAPASYTDGSSSWEELTGRLLIEWSPDLSMTDDTLLYASFSRGYKGGGFNPPHVGTDFKATFDPEFINAYEVGMKNTMWDNTLTANFTAFKYDYEGLQVSKIVNRSSLNENIDATIWGLEAEMLYSPSEKWSTNLTWSYLNTEITDAHSIDPRDPTNGQAGLLLIKDLGGGASCVMDPGAMDIGTALAYIGGAGALPTGTVAVPGLASVGAHTLCDAAVAAAIAGIDAAPDVGTPGWIDGEASVVGGIEADLSGNELQNSPAWTLNFGTQRTFHYDNGLALTARADYYVQGEMYGRIFNKPIDKIGGWDMLNMSLGLTSEEGNWDLKAFVTNVMDDDNITGHYLTDASSGNFTNVFVLEPRLYGVAFSSRF